LEEALLEAINFVGSQKKLALLLGVGCPVLNNWLNAGIKVPLKYALKIEVKTQGLVKAERLMPDAKEEIRSYIKYILEAK
jgi:DNA-binding transcriptional regulator YdaS (Cro superfamily)